MGMKTVAVLSVIIHILVNSSDGFPLTFKSHGNTSTDQFPDYKTECDQTGTKGTENDQEEVEWFEKCVVQYYGLQQSPKILEEYLKDTIPDTFKNTATRIENFFKRNDDWIKIKANPLYNNPETRDSKRLLILTHARYLYVAYLLSSLSQNKSQTPCTVCSEDKITRLTIVPPEGKVCFLENFGSSNPTSDHDVTLVGPNSGTLTIAFNRYFSDVFEKPSEQVLDTNIYAYSLEYAIPQAFSGLSMSHTSFLAKADCEAQFQMLELAGAYMKMYRFNQNYYARLEKNAEKNLGGQGIMKTVRNRNHYFITWISMFVKMEKIKSMTGGDDLRNANNEEYGKIINQIGEMKLLNTPYANKIQQYIIKMSKALMYAAEAYHTRGAMRHVVGVIQFKVLTNIELTMLDYWVSMIENWADANKAFNHCEVSPGAVGACLLTMTKYLFRTFNAMKEIHNRLTSQVQTVYNILNKYMIIFQKNNPVFKKNVDPYVLTKYWLEKYKGKTNEIPNSEVEIFRMIFKCSLQNLQECLDSIEHMVEAYDHFLIELTKAPTTEAFILLTGNGKIKTCQASL